MIDVKKYKEMDCPVCGKFHFSEVDISDIEIYDYIQCRHCGWICDAEQSDNPELENGLNELSLKAFKINYEAKLVKNPNYCYCDDIYVERIHMCPVCGKYKFSDEGMFEICPYCGWIDDSLMEEEPDKWGGCSNDLCLNDFRERYKSFVEKKLNYKYSKDGLGI